MGFEQINTADFDYQMMLATINAAYIGKAEITLSNYDNDSEPVIKVGAKIEVNGALIKLTTDDATPTGYTGITNSTTFYLYYDESAGVAIYSETVPVWNDALQGWYNSNDRAFFSMFKDSGGTLYQSKALLLAQNNLEVGGFVKYPSKRITSANRLEGTRTQNECFDKLDPFLPNTGDSMLVSGCIYLSNIFYVFAFATRETSSTIGLHGYNFSIETGFPNSNTTYILTDGSGTSIAIMLAW